MICKLHIFAPFYRKYFGADFSFYPALFLNQFPSYPSVHDIIAIGGDRMKITVDLNSVVPIAVIDAVNEMMYPLRVIELSDDPNEFLKQLSIYINEYSDEFSEILKQQFMVRVTERVAVDLKTQGISIVPKEDS